MAGERLGALGEVRLDPPRLRSLDTRSAPETPGPNARDQKALDEKAPGKPRRWSRELFGAAYDRLGHDDGDGLAAGLAFGALLSIAPLLLVVLAVSSAFLGDEGARAHLESLVGDALGQPAVAMIDQWITDARQWTGTATVLGTILFLIGSARLVGFVDGAFKVVFDVEPPATAPTILQQVRQYFTTQAKTLGVTLGAGLLMVGSLVLRAIGESIFGGTDSTLVSVLWVVGREVISFAVWALALMLVYWALPPMKIDRSAIFLGALVSASLVEAALLVLRLGASFFDFGAAYGAAGAIIGVLVTLYIVSQLFLYGAELTAELASRTDEKIRSSRDGCPKRVAQPRAVPTSTLT